MPTKFVFFILCLIQMALAQEVGVPFLPLAHSSSVTMIDGNQTILVSGSQDSTVKVWDLTHKKLIKTFDKHEYPIAYVKLIPEANLVLSIDRSQQFGLKQLYLWDIRTEKIYKEHNLSIDDLQSVSFIPNTTLLLITGWKKTILFNLTNGEKHDVTFYFPGYYSGSKFIKTAKVSKKILVHEPGTNQKLLLYDINGTLDRSIDYDTQVCTAALSDDLRYIAASFDDKTIKIWEQETGKLLTTLENKKGCGNDTLAFSSSGESLAMASGYGVTIWDVKSSQKRYTHPFHSGQISVNAFAFVDDDHYVIGLESGNVRYVDLKEAKEVSFNTYARHVSKVILSDNGKNLYTSNNRNHTYQDMRPKKYFSLLNYKTKEETKLFHTEDEKYVSALHLTQNSFITGHADGSIGLWDVNKKIKRITKNVYESSVSHIDVSTDERMIALGSSPGKINVLDANTLQQVFAFDANESSTILRFSPDRKHLLHVTLHHIKVWETSRWNLQLDMNISAVASDDVVFTERHSVIAMDNDGNVVEYDLETKEKRMILDFQKFLQDHKLVDETIDYFLFSHKADKGLFLVNDQTFIVDFKTGRKISIDVPFENNGFFTTLFYFSYDDEVLASVKESKLYLWDVKTGKQISSSVLYTFDKDEIISAAPFGDIKVDFSSNSPFVASATKKTFFPPFTADEINIWDTEKLKVLKKLSASRYTAGIHDFALADNKILYGSQGELTYISMDGSEAEKIGEHDVYHKVEVYKDKYLLGMTSQNIFLMDAKTKKLLKRFNPLSGFFTSATFTPDGVNIIATSQNPFPQTYDQDTNNTIVFYDTSTGKIVNKLGTFGSTGVDSIVLSQNGTFLSLIHNYFISENTIKPVAFVFNLETNTTIQLKGHTERINSIAMNKENRFIITGSDDNTIKQWDLHSGKLIHTYIGHQGRVNSVSFHPTKPYIVSGSDDGTVKYWSIETKELLATFVSFENEWLILTPEGFFNGTVNAAKKLNILYDFMSVGDMKSLYDTFFRPDLVKLKLQGMDISPYIKHTDIKAVLQNKPPTVQLTEVDEQQIKEQRFEVYTDHEKVNLTFNVKENGGGVGLIRIYQEGKLIQTIGEGRVNKNSANIDAIIEQEKLDSTLKENQKIYIASLSKSVQDEISIEETIAKVVQESISNHSGEYTLELELKSGKNEISIEAFNQTNTVTSYRESVTINANIPKQEPKLYAIVAGVNDFEAPSVNNLKYSQNDAEAIKAAAQKKMNTVFDKVEVTYLTAQEVTKENILQSVKEISQKATLDDTVLFYISTHGRAARGKLYLVPYNNKSVKNWIDFEQTFQAVQSIKALNQIFVIDACESGKANDIVSSVYDSRASVLAKSSGVHMLLATTKGTSAFEHPDPTIKNGVFTYRILEAINDQQTDLNQDQWITIKELSKKLQEPTNNADYQYPVIRNVGKDVKLERLYSNQ